MLKDKIIRGKITVASIETSDMDSGTTGLVYHDNKYKHVYVLHADKDKDWVVEGDYSGTIPREEGLFKLMVTHSNGISTPIRLSHVKKVINADLIGKEHIEFVIEPFPFKEGSYSGTCTTCDSWFNGAKRQPLCKKCCMDASVAYLGNVKGVRAGKVKTSTITVTAAKNIAKEAMNLNFAEHSEPAEEVFNSWFLKQLKKWR